MMKPLGIFVFVLCCTVIVLTVLLLESENFDSTGLKSTESINFSTLSKSLPASNEKSNGNDNFVAADAEENLFEVDPLFPSTELAEGEIAFIDPIGVEGRQFAEVTAHMSDLQLMKYRELRKGSIVRTAEGVLQPPYEVVSSCELEKVNNECWPVIINTLTKAIAFNERWKPDYISTGVGQEVVKEK